MTKPAKLTTQELFLKARAERGVLGVLKAGLRSTDIADPDTAAKWRTMSTKWTILNRKFGAFVAALNRPTPARTELGFYLSNEQLRARIEGANSDLFTVIMKGTRIVNIADPVVATAWAGLEQGWYNLESDLGSMEARLLRLGRAGAVTKSA
jgi:hypothetical protein